MQLDFWRGSPGQDYVARNSLAADVVKSRCLMWQRILASTYPNYPSSALDVGANIGRNLRALHTIRPQMKLHAVEPGQHALAELRKQPFVDVDRTYEASAESMPFPDESIDMVFTCGVLIHIHPNNLLGACEEIVRVAKRWVVAIEYFAPDCEMIRYQGQDDRLWRNDFGRFYVSELNLKQIGRAHV